jgi:glycosyltransferase involved in cell wall biosynthesis
MKADRSNRIVLYTESPTTGGVTAVVEEIAIAAASSFHCTLVCGDNARLRIWGGALRSRGIDVAHLALRNRADIFGWFEVFSLIKLHRVLREASIVHFHLHTTFSCQPVILLARLVARTSVLTTEHYVAQIRFLRNRRLQFPLAAAREILIAAKLTLKKMSLQCVNRIVTVSEANRLFMLSTFANQPGNRILAIPNGVDVDQFASGSPTHSELGDPVVATIAGLNNQKGHEYLIKAIPLIKQHCPKAKFVFAGEGHLRERLEQLAVSLGAMDAITFVGKLEDVRPLLAQAAQVALPSLFEGMPISILEAMAAGRAVVATDVDGTSELVIDGLTGFLVPPRNPEKLAEKIVVLLKNRELRDTFGRNAQRRARDKFSLEHMTASYLKLYQQCMSESKKTSA